MAQRTLSLRQSYDATDLGFRLLFSLVFLGLGFEHLFSDGLIRSMMPAWLPAQRALSIAAGVLLLAGGTAVATGFRLRAGAALLAGFLVAVTVLVHVPALAAAAPDPACEWLWDVYQRSNTFKNLCLLGGCLHLLNHRVGRFALAPSARGSTEA